MITNIPAPSTTVLHSKLNAKSFTDSVKDEIVHDVGDHTTAGECGYVKYLKTREIALNEEQIAVLAMLSWGFDKWLKLVFEKYSILISQHVRLLEWH